MQYKTPYYVIHKEELDSNFDKLVTALKKHWNNFIIGYSYKTNALPWVIKYFDCQGCYAEVVSDDEYNLAKLIGVNKKNIIYNGPIKTKETFFEAIKNGCIVNIDSRREIEWLGEISTHPVKIGIRVNFDIEAMCPGQSQCGIEGGRFGFCYENCQFDEAVNDIQAMGHEIVGLHLHVSSKSRGLDIYKAIAAVACDIEERYQFGLEYVDVGGGFFGGLPTKPQFDEYIMLMSSILAEKFSPEKTTLIIEPGMALIGAVISYVTSVIDIKDTTYNRFVVTDGTRTSIDPLMNKSSYFHKYEKINGVTPILPKQVVCGYTCMEHDRLFECINEEELCIGDKIIYNKVGAYTMCLTPLFIKYFPDVYVEHEGFLKKVRDAWTPMEYVQKTINEENRV